MAASRFLPYAFFCCLVCIVLFLASGEANAAEEIIDSFRADIEVGKEGTFVVKEEITYTFPEERHGIFRCIPLLHAEPASSYLKERYIDISFERVLLDGARVPFSEARGSEACLKIGDPDQVITGTHTYVLEYEVGGALNYPEYGGAELYWNVTGNEWDVPMTAVEAHLVSRDGIFTRERACYQGRTGDTTSCEILTNEDGSVTFTGKFFAPGEGLTIAQALNRNAIPYDVRERYRPILLWGLLILGSLVGGGGALYRYKTRFKTGKTIIPQYEPYPNVKPMYAGLLFDRRLDPRDVTAGIVFLAREGYVKIRKVDAKVLFFFEVDDYEIELTQPIANLGGAFEEELLVMLFDNRDAEVGKKVSLRDLKQNHAEVRENYLLLQSLKSRLSEDLKVQGFIIGFNFGSLFSTPFIVSLVVVALLFRFVSNTALVIFIVGLGIVGVVLALGRRTRKGYEALDHLRGFKEFLSVTEKERYIFHNAPERNAEQFMEYLPYAIAFGVEKQWAKTFEGITIPNPPWYDGGSGMHSFSAGNMTQSLGAFSSALASSGTSASSGGGSSGGGSGGGGGGSW